ncbi:hypothetical protein E8E11_012000 [Didymella keratinophila]|nr:hypothetical protein E8E11_012000 [Didymella keratinophila]
MRYTVPTLLAMATTALASPVTTTSIYPSQRADVQALIAAANLPSPPANVSDPSTLISKNCGRYIIKGGWAFDLNADPQCSGIEYAKIMHRVYNNKCGLCVTFQWQQCVGDIT